MNFIKKLFKSKPRRSGIIFIVEDDTLYAKTLSAFIKTKFPDIKEVKIFPVGETCLMELHRNPDAIIVDYFLNTKYADAETGMQTVKQIRAQKLNTTIILLSAQNEIDVVLEAVKTYQCKYIKKDEQAFDRVEEIIKKI